MHAPVTIDTASEPGSWASAIAHTPHLAAMVADGDHETTGGRRSARAGEAGSFTPRSPASPGRAQFDRLNAYLRSEAFREGCAALARAVMQMGVAARASWERSR